jgi:DNA repair protein RadC
MEKHYTVKELPIEERPYEKCEKFGADCLSDAELLAVIIRTGSRSQSSVELAQHILTECGGFLEISRCSLKRLCRIHGVGRVKAVQLQCIGELSKRIAMTKKKERIRLDSPKAFADYFADYFMEDMRFRSTEVLRAVFLDTKQGMIKHILISSGTVNMSVASPREIFVEALRYEACSVCLLHNHPSGDPTPSREDIHATKRIRDAGRLLGIQLLDHIVIGDKCYVSLREQGYL